MIVSDRLEKSWTRSNCSATQCSLPHRSSSLFSRTALRFKQSYVLVAFDHLRLLGMAVL